MRFSIPAFTLLVTAKAHDELQIVNRDSSKCLSENKWGKAVLLPCGKAGQTWRAHASGLIENAETKHCLFANKRGMVKVRQCNKNMNPLVSKTVEGAMVLQGTQSGHGVATPVHTDISFGLCLAQRVDGEAQEFDYVPVDSQLDSPTAAPTKKPTKAPSSMPSSEASSTPTRAHSIMPSSVDSAAPTKKPTKAPSSMPSSSGPCSVHDSCEGCVNHYPDNPGGSVCIPSALYPSLGCVYDGDPDAAGNIVVHPCLAAAPTKKPTKAPSSMPSSEAFYPSVPCSEDDWCEGCVNFDPDFPGGNPCSPSWPDASLGCVYDANCVGGVPDAAGNIDLLPCWA